MSESTIDLIKRSMADQISRTHYPADFPPLPGIPTGRYHDPDFAAAEMARLWKRTWLFAGVESQLADAGSYFLFEQVGESVILCRAKDGAIRAFHNICSHRGSVLLTEPAGRAARFVCPYHAWSFALDGRLLAVPEAHEFACLDKAGSGLLPVRCEIWRGLIFINLDPDAEPLAAFMAPAAAYTQGFPLENLVVQDHYFVELECNWKLAYHNFTEAYHTRIVHPQTLAQYVDQRSWMAYLLRNGHARIAVDRTGGASLYASDAEIPDAIEPIFRAFGLCQTFFPNAFSALDPSGFAIQTFWPAGPGRSIMEVHLVGWEPKGRRADYWAGLRATMDEILQEDVRLFAHLQRNIESGRLSRLQIGYLERTIYWFEEEVDRRIGEANIAPELRVDQVLADQMAG